MRVQVKVKSHESGRLHREREKRGNGVGSRESIKLLKKKTGKTEDEGIQGLAE